MINTKIVIATIKSWNISNAERFRISHPDWNITIISDKSKLNIERLNEIKPDFVFFPHWSWIISEDIFKQFTCIVFHMTDLPFGRGGSPLQNLISRGIYKTKISAISVTNELDAGDVYYKEDLDISEGSADDILRHVSDIIFNVMIPKIVEDNLNPKAQEGDVTVFVRRKPEQSEIPTGLTQRHVYDYIRMLDGEGYPPAYIQMDGKKIVFRKARMLEGKVIAEASFE